MQPKPSADFKNVPLTSVDLSKPLKNTDLQKLQGKMNSNDKNALTNLFLVETARKDSANKAVFSPARKDSDKLTESESDPADLDLTRRTLEVAPTKKDVVSARRPNMGWKPPLKKLDVGKVAVSRFEDGR